ncbi:MAG: aldolase/citrate lyase family protein, partial [Gemmobacter sp.]|nr:aldolase/citrate lyase family protein [Gemmobacter sp.]
VGPGDLGVSMGAFGDAGRPRLQAAIATIATAARAAGRTVGMYCASATEIPRWRDMGISFFLIGNDTSHLGAAVTTVMTQARGV